MKIPRRSSLQVLAAAVFAPLSFLPKLSLAQIVKLKATPQDVEGPYYPTTWNGEVDNDLTTLNGKKYTGGIPMTLRGRVRGDSGEILKDARVEIWQIDDVGEYRHPGFGGEKPAQRGFQGYGWMQTDDGGQYTFQTIKPIGYSGRPPHVHFKVIAPGYITLITEMYFAGENAEGSLYQRLFGGFSRERDLLSISPNRLSLGKAETLDAVFDIVLARL
ncbi:intradiol ring-cleavage dioxygenase [Variovorax sp. PCZ-1]|uniref:dioxygenase family protein n=1 Tax=Variovorax sp. PCZ-1 TaxID=2835533 RepID=UPI001BCEB2D0|nr:intradiol ring-cleavage dioxygenase [Variovorax sp. PCZ-1]MBS7807790.1 intradiol ring-cleavage dioxygenase [Variovorax sp. PCZ-1]